MLLGYITSSIFRIGRSRFVDLVICYMPSSAMGGSDHDVALLGHCLRLDNPEVRLIFYSSKSALDKPAPGVCAASRA